MIRDKLNTMTIRQKINIIVILAVLIPYLLMSVIFFQHIYNATLTDTIQQKQTEIEEIEPKISRVIRSIVQDAETISKDSFFQSLKKMSSGTDLTYSSVMSEESQNFFESVRKLEDSSALAHARIYVDLPKNDALFTEEAEDNIFCPISDVQGSYWHGIFRGSGYGSLFCPAFYLTGYEKENLGNLAYLIPFSGHRNGRIVPCYLALYYSMDQITDVLAEYSGGDGTVSYLINNREAIVTSTDEHLSGIYHFNYDDVYELMLSSNNYMEKEIIGQNVYLTFKYIEEPNWFLINVVPASVIMKTTYKMLLKSFLFVLLFLVISILMATRLSSSVSNRISSVIATMSKTREGNLVPMEEPKVMDEIGNLIATYNYMTERQRILTENLQKTADELRIAEVNALQAQINPHFLYNTLDTIQWLALSGDSEDVSVTVQNLSRFYRLTLGKDLTNTSIGREIEHASIYVELQNLRFNNAIELIVDIPEEMEDLYIPRLTLQPVVENAILHGIREKESQSGCVVITGWEEEEDVYLVISDDGVGISEDVLPKILRDDETNPSSGGTNIAIYNVHHRLQLLYGENYGLSYASRPGEGTEVTVHLPRHEQKTSAKQPPAE